MTSSDFRDHTLFACCIHLYATPERLTPADPPGMHDEAEAIGKAHRLCHTIHKIPITWLCSYTALGRYGDTLRRYYEEYGDEVAIMEGAILNRSTVGEDAGRLQGWVEECGLARPGDNVSKEPELPGGKGLHEYSAADQRKALAYLKQRYDEIIGANTRTLGCAWAGGDTIAAMKAVGLDVLWGYCWNYFCEGINHKGCPPVSFYVDSQNHNVPDQAAGGPRVLAVHWGPFSPVIGMHVETHCRQGQAAFCLNALELTNRSEGTDRFRYHENVIRETLGQAEWNPFAFLPLQLEACWFSERGFADPEYYDPFPRFSSHNAEAFYTEIDTALRAGARPVTLSGFANWFAEHVGDTAETVIYSEDLLPEVRSKGKDQAYPPFVIYSDKSRQLWFDKGCGFNPVRTYRYAPVVRDRDIAGEQPFDGEPPVVLKLKTARNLRAGIVLDDDGATYEATDLELTAREDVPDYAAILWQANLPEYVRDEDIEFGGAVTGFRTVRPKNLAILFASLRKGDNAFVFRSEVPRKFVRIVESALVGKRWEIWVENMGGAVRLQRIRTRVGPGLRLGGFWWNGQYSRTIYRYGWGAYDRAGGGLDIQLFYPATLEVVPGLNRLSLELL